MYASKQAPFLITETNAGAIGGSATNFPAFDGQWRQAAWAFVARGAEMIEYWHWHTNHFGTETYWVGILPHDQQPGRVYARAEPARRRVPARPGRGWSACGPTPRSACCTRPDPSGDWRSRRPFRSPAKAIASALADVDQRSYHRIFEAFYRGTFDAGVPARLIHDDQIIGAGRDALLDPADRGRGTAGAGRARLLVADDALLTWLRDYAAAGGHLVIGPRTAYGDEEGRARIEVKPAHLAEAAGVRYQEFSNLGDPLPVVAETDGSACRTRRRRPTG